MMPTPAQSPHPEAETLISRLKLLLPPLVSTQRSSWEQGIASQALLECHQFFEQAQVPEVLLPYNLLQYIYALAHDSLVRQAPDGRLAVLLNGSGTSDPGAADPACIGESLYFLISRVHPQQQAMVEGVEKMLSYIVNDCPRARVSHEGAQDELLLSHRTDVVQIWSDAVYMLPSFLVSAALFYSNSTDPLFDPKRLLRMGLQQVALAAKVLQAPSGEWSHIFDLSTYEFKRKAFWGVGNGWVSGGIIRVFRALLHASPSLFEGEPELQELLLENYHILKSTLRAA